MTLPTLDDLAHAIRSHNPFRQNRVSAPEDVQVDVSAIHEAEFRRMVRALDAIGSDDPSMGIALLGPSGVGKSHLLGRLHAFAQQRGNIKYVLLHNLQVSPQRMPRYLLKATLRALCSYRRGTYGTASLYSMLLNALPESHDALALPLWQVANEDPEDLAIHGVLTAFLALLSLSEPQGENHRQAAVAVDWLSGEPIDPEDAQALSRLCGQRIPTVLQDNHAIERAFTVLTQLLGATQQSLVLCLDQIDNLDPDQVRALVSFLHALIDHTNNLVVICSGVTTSMDRLRECGTIPEAAWDRLGELRVDLLEIRKAEALDILLNRLAAFFAPFSHLQPLAELRARDPLFPLGRPFWEQRTADLLQVRPRDVISWARFAWQARQEVVESAGLQALMVAADPPATPRADTDGKPDHEALDRYVQGKLHELIRKRFRNPGGLPPDADNLATLTRLLLGKCIGHTEDGLVAVEQEIPAGRKAKRYDLHIVRRSPLGEEIRSRVLFMTAVHGNGVTTALGRLADDVDTPGQLWLVTDKRQPLKLGMRGAEHLARLQQRGPSRFQHLRLTFEAYAELDALADLLGQARVGDVEITEGEEPRVVSESDLVISYHRLERLRNHGLLRHLLRGGVPTPADTAPLEQGVQPHEPLG